MIAGLVLASSLPASACMYFDKAFDRKLFEETEREAFMFRDAQAVNLILKTGFTGKMPPKLAWVFPLPSKPLSYKEVDADIFGELREHFVPMTKGGLTDSLGAPSNSLRSMPKSITIHEKVVVGGYEIIPIEILSEKSAGDEMNSWLRSQNFIELPARIQKPYLKKGAYFLAIRMTPRGDDLSVKPLWVRYVSNEMTFPLRFTHDERTFDFTLYILGADAMIVGAGGNQTQASCVRLEKIKPTDLPAFLPKVRALAKDVVNPKVLYKIRLEGINKYLKTSTMGQDPGLVESSRSSFCR